jgi:hypothetical protein
VYEASGRVAQSPAELVELLNALLVMQSGLLQMTPTM